MFHNSHSNTVILVSDILAVKMSTYSWTNGCHKILNKEESEFINLKF